MGLHYASSSDFNLQSLNTWYDNGKTSFVSVVIFFLSWNIVHLQRIVFIVSLKISVTFSDGKPWVSSLFWTINMSDYMLSETAKLQRLYAD